jgi:hypothetical protein
VREWLALGVDSRRRAGRLAALAIVAVRLESASFVGPRSKGMRRQSVASPAATSRLAYVGRGQQEVVGRQILHGRRRCSWTCRRTRMRLMGDWRFGEPEDQRLAQVYRVRPA